jgi:hypothetical protein
MNQDKSQQFMASMMKLTESMETQIHGNIAPKFLITCLLEPLLTIKYSVFMEA